MTLLPPQLLGKLRRSRFRYAPPASTGHGDRRSRQPGEGIEFEEYRAYEPGDDFRQVDPAVFLRTGQYQVKRYAVERAADVLVLLDMSESMATGQPSKLLLARQLAASLAYVALAGGDRVRVGVVAQRSEWSRKLQGLARFQELSRWLSDRKGSGGAVEPVILERMLTSGAKGGARLVFLVSDCLIDGIEEVLRRLRAAELDLIVHQVMSPEELDPSLLGVGRIDLLDSETGDLVEGELSAATLSRYQAELGSWNSAIERSLRSPESYFLTRSDSSVDEIVLGRWRARGLIS